MRGSADIDLVVFFNGLSSIDDLVSIREWVLNHVETNIAGYRPWQGRIARKKRTRFSVSYVLDGHKVDILPAFDLTSEYFRALVTLYVVKYFSDHLTSPYVSIL